MLRILKLSNGALTKTLVTSITLIGVLILLLYSGLTKADEQASAAIIKLQEQKADKETVTQMAEQIQQIYNYLIPQPQPVELVPE